MAASFLSNHVQSRTQYLLHSFPAYTGYIRLACLKHGNSGALLRDDKIGHILVLGHPITPVLVSGLQLDKGTNHAESATYKGRCR